ncbi:hypothetical protein HanXRQr2_Chr06g0274171 [Helianthus annuus]|uniref:Uncharacterized protein n=1 Tax=Helianthus annuus TaxID=4232 RepID=A0A9K3IVB7_HELAN|nr:hypothetical protein HanXRQr2_Chr06g0274171 [Helianthus annuus]KAJ0916701.1 hypothetical protein HanPSC8_Chr06g0264831 [Helianthus annuus]
MTAAKVSWGSGSRSERKRCRSPLAAAGGGGDGSTTAEVVIEFSLGFARVRFSRVFGSVTVQIQAMLWVRV